MKLDFFYVMSNLVSLFIIAAVGYAAARSGLVHEKDTAPLSALLMKVTMPCTIFISLVQREYNPAFINDSIIMLIAGITVFPAMLYIAKYTASLLKVPKNCRGLWAFAATITNAGFMGFPIALALFGSEGLALAVTLNITYNVSVFTVGVMELSRDNPENKSHKIDIKSFVFSSVNYAIVLSLIFYFGRIKLPSMIATPLIYISNVTTPLSMMIIGMILARSKWAELFTDKHAWTCALMGLLIFPLSLCLIFRIFPLGSNPLTGAVLILTVSMPSASITAALSEMYHCNVNFAAKAMFIQNIFCVLTIPLVCMMIG